MIQQLKTTLAGMYGISTDSVYLFKSGRAAIRGCLEALKRRDPGRTTVCIPDYVCNVVERACVVTGLNTGIHKKADIAV